MTVHSPGREVDSAKDLESLQLLVEATARKSGSNFFQSLVRSLCKALNVKNAFVSEFAESKCRVRTVAFCRNGQIVENTEWGLKGTPCEEVLRGQLCLHPSNVFKKFPLDLALEGIESYMGVALYDAQGEVMGHLAVFDDRPLPRESRLVSLFELFAGRAANELERLRQEAILQESHQRFRDLFDEAPIAYVHEDLQSKFICANKKALQILGLRADEVQGTVGKSFIPDTTDAQRRFDQAFDSIGSGTDTSGMILELRRKDDGRPIWIEWWSRPDPSGEYTRTMFIDITERVELAQAQVRLQAENAYLKDEIKSVHNFEEIVGKSPKILEVLSQVERVADTESTVLITGETGTGKELIARAIHSHSRRRNQPLIKLNCAALPSGLVESELFGHEKGAFSGAVQRRIGRFELAHGGTIFLDEIGEMPMEVQVKLLRVLQEREFERVGGTRSVQVDVRVIAATNRDLKRMVQEGKFREDLFYRLHVFPMVLPPLRHRKEDILLLASHFLQKNSARIGRDIRSIEQESIDNLLEYSWPGNIRELQNTIERALILSTGSELSIDPDFFATQLPTAELSNSPENLNAVQRDHILSILQSTGGVIEGDGGAARLLGLHPNTLRSRMKKLGIQRVDGRFR